ncbi:hypothetical protein EMQ25_00660 [Arsenicitalea aurantiaca]|uniref:TIGR02186 family protein n=1 Tax=Arsenicitalea aurantiaca TaxID=1783274 RepID=A0A433XKB4_9HYPH|nr:TIGR02186 family protein [Arsenicitalea aurantiaca]RUT34509.1 hypothetical protein EMQ25_00660 [Arsenicitalea aurantiaca]
MRIFCALILLIALVVPAGAQRLVSTLSNQTVAISSSFDGETLTMFGNVEPAEETPLAAPQGPYEVVILVTGPLTDRVARRKTRQFGIWINTEQVLFERFPSYFHVLASRPLAEITTPATLAAEGILPEVQAERAARTDWWSATIYARELVRLMTERRYFGVEEPGVRFLSTTAYSAQLTLPHDVPNGAFLATTLVFSDGEIVARRAERFNVRKVGFERFLGNAAVQYPLFYGVFCVFLALFTGWLGGVVFKR